MYDAIPLATGNFMSFYVILVTLPFSFSAADPSIIPHFPNIRVQQPARGGVNGAAAGKKLFGAVAAAAGGYVPLGAGKGGCL